MKEMNYNKLFYLWIEHFVFQIKEFKAQSKNIKSYAYVWHIFFGNTQLWTSKPRAFIELSKYTFLYSFFYWYFANNLKLEQISFEWKPNYFLNTNCVSSLRETVILNAKRSFWNCYKSILNFFRDVMDTHF